MQSRIGNLVAKLAVAVASGVLLRFTVDLHPIWWVAWLAPFPLLLMALRMRPQDARWMVLIAALTGTSCNFHYFRLVMPLFPAMTSVAGLALLWIFVVLTARRVIVRFQSWWTVFVYPVLWVAVDTLMAALLRDGNWGSLAYSQGDQLIILQITALIGTAGVVFLLSLAPSALALACAYGRSLHRGWIAYSVPALCLGLAVLYGALRLEKPQAGVETTFGLVSIDDPIGLHASASYAASIYREYDRGIAEVAARGAQVVVLPEKIAMYTPQTATQEQQHLSAVAKQNHVWLEAGVGIDDGQRPTNWEWLFAPDGALAASYEKHHMAPPERRAHYASGTDYVTVMIGGERYGLAVCKDMHFAALGRAYGQRGVAVMLVPAWDFGYQDGWLEARTTLVRGIENGYAVVRAAREGMLTVSDAYGRIAAETPSDALPGRTLVASLRVSAPVATLYTRIGNLFGWLCVAAAAAFLLLGSGRIVLTAKLRSTG